MGKLILIVFVAVAIVSCNGETDEEFLEKFIAKLQNAASECQQDTGASDDDIGELVAQKLPSTHEGKCMLFCLGKKFGVGTDEGHIDHDGTMKAMEKIKDRKPDDYKTYIKITETCEKEVVYDADPCVSSYNAISCVKKYAAEYGVEMTIG